MWVQENPAEASTWHWDEVRGAHARLEREEQRWGCAQGFPGDSVGKDSAYSAGEPCLIPGLGRCSGEGNGNPLQYSGLENSTERGVWWATVHGVTKSRTRPSI